MEASLAVDAIPGFVRSDIDRALLRIPPDPQGTVVAIEDGRVVGYCTTRRDDLTVHPDDRRRGHGRALVAEALVVALGGHGHLTLYVPSHLEGSRHFAEVLGFSYHSSLWQFQLDPLARVPRPAFAAGFVLRRFDPARDTDLAEWVAFMHAAFAGHPTPMSWTTEIASHVHAAADFDPTGILIVSPAEAPERPVAFARIALDPGEASKRAGVVGLIGVLPAWRRRGLGRELLRWGVTELRDRGAGRIDLSVEADNDGATVLYRAHGFVPVIEWPHWRLATG